MKRYRKERKSWKRKREFATHSPRSKNLMLVNPAAALQRSLKKPESK